MFLRVSTFFNNRCARYLLIAGAFVLVVIVLAVNQEPSEPVRVCDPLEPHRVRFTTSPVFDAVALKKTIIENNLFRPLGWTRPVPVPAYRLTGTIISRNSKVPPRALILSIADHKTHIVTLGAKLGADTSVIEIRSKDVILESGGERITLKLDLSAWLRRSKVGFSRGR